MQEQTPGYGRLFAAVAAGDLFRTTVRTSVIRYGTRHRELSAHKLLALVMALVMMLGLLVSQSVFAVTPFRDLMNTDGKIVDTSRDFGHGKWTLVMLWSTDCVICTKQNPMISAFHEKHRNVDAQVIGIALDGPMNIDNVNAYIERHQLPFTNYIGRMDLVAMNYQILTQEPLRGTPTYLLFDPQGNLKGNNPGPVRAVAVEEFMARHTK